MTKQLALGGQPAPLLDLIGQDTTLFHYAAEDPARLGGQYLVQALACFESMCSTVSRDQPR